MKKKTLAVLLAISCTLSIAACGATGGDETSASEEKISTESGGTGQNAEKKALKEPAEVPADLSDNLYDFQVAINGTVYQIPMWYSDMEALGWQFKGGLTGTLSADEHTREKWRKDGIDIYTYMFNPSINTIAYSESIVCSIELRRLYLKDCDWDIILPGGIQWEVSSYDDIIAAYGNPSFESESDFSYHLSYDLAPYRQYVTLIVSKEDGVLEEIEIANRVELEGLDNSVSEEVPDIVKAYQAPESLSDDLHEYNVQLEGVVYALPCPVSVLVENGFTIVTSKSDMELATGASGSVVFCYGDRILSVKVKNYADYATTIENCSVTSLETWGLKTDVDIVFPGNIKLGDSEDSLKQVLKGVEYFKEKDGDYTYYWMTDAKNTSPEIYTFIVSNKKIIYMDINYRENPEY
ncbi:MAG: hypothetical protein J1F42_05945 [Lachnospiraceae bacterium]|nr:hypothetical protein [Lachnospiraceae bacterium]